MWRSKPILTTNPFLIQVGLFCSSLQNPLEKWFATCTGTETGSSPREGVLPKVGVPNCFTSTIDGKRKGITSPTPTLPNTPWLPYLCKVLSDTVPGSKWKREVIVMRPKCGIGKNKILHTLVWRSFFHLRHLQLRCIPGIMPEGEILTKLLWSLYEAKINPWSFKVLS